MVKRYLEIDSTYRDRNRFSNPSDFEIPISQAGARDRFTALDPVSLSTPLTIFDGSWSEIYGKYNENNPYVKAFLEWWPELSKTLMESLLGIKQNLIDTLQTGRIN